MAKLYFRYGAMGSSKTANALMVRYNYLEKGQNPLLLKPRVDQRDGDHVVWSRIGLEAECMLVEEFTERMGREGAASGEFIRQYDAVIVDEAQFLTEKQADFLGDVVDRFDIPVLCYGLRTDFQSHLFEGSRRLMEIADVIEEISTVCWCGKRANFNARFQDGKIIRDGSQVFLGGNESYVALCRKHFKEGRLHG